MEPTTLLRTELEITLVKESFSKLLSQKLQLIPVSCPLAVLDGTGINDDLNGTERPVTFPIKSLPGKRAVVVHSLAKWKRLRLNEYGIAQNHGIITDMRALRPDEDLSPIHSIYVDQWDWEKHISPADRELRYLKASVTQIYDALKETEKLVEKTYPEIQAVLPETITFIHAEELLQRYPDLNVKERETEIAKEYGAVFITGIGGELSNGIPHDDRAPDYDDWTTINEDGYQGLNGDIIVWHPVLQSAFELSSMGIRVDKTVLKEQLKLKGLSSRSELYFHQLLLSGQLPESIGGGIGQSRLCMFMLKKGHIKEVQTSIWPEEQIEPVEVVLL